MRQDGRIETRPAWHFWEIALKSHNVKVQGVDAPFRNDTKNSSRALIPCLCNSLQPDCSSIFLPEPQQDTSFAGKQAEGTRLQRRRIARSYDNSIALPPRKVLESIEKFKSTINLAVAADQTWVPLKDRPQIGFLLTFPLGLQF